MYFLTVLSWVIGLYPNTSNLLIYLRFTRRKNMKILRILGAKHQSINYGGLPDPVIELRLEIALPYACSVFTPR